MKTPVLNLTVRLRSTKRGSRRLRVNLTLRSSIFSALASTENTSAERNRSFLPSPFWRSSSKVYTTSSAPKGLPSDHVTPSRRSTTTEV